jgi:hypothetical protein
VPKPESNLEDQDLFEVNIHKLEIQLADQSGLFRHYARKKAEAAHQVRVLKASLDQVVSELQLAIRSNPDHYDIDKVTDNSVKAAVTVHKRYREANARVLDAIHLEEIIEADTSAMNRRGYDIDGAIKLHGQAYFQKDGTYLTGSSREAVEDAAKRKARRSGGPT